MKEKSTTTLVIQHHVQIRSALERVVKLQDKRVIDFLQYLLFQLDVAEVVFLFQEGLVEHFHCIVGTFCTLLSLLHEENFGKATLTQ